MLGRRHRNTRRKPAPVPLCPPQIPHVLTREGTWTRPKYCLSGARICGMYYIALDYGDNASRAETALFNISDRWGKACTRSHDEADRDI
jgi:hypothetical protein